MATNYKSEMPKDVAEVIKTTRVSNDNKVTIDVICNLFPHPVTVNNHGTMIAGYATEEAYKHLLPANKGVPVYVIPCEFFEKNGTKAKQIGEVYIIYQGEEIQKAMESYETKLNKINSTNNKTSKIPTPDEEAAKAAMIAPGVMERLIENELKKRDKLLQDKIIV